MPQITVRQLEKCIDRWHDSESSQGIKEYLGMTTEEFFEWRTQKKVPDSWNVPSFLKKYLGI